MQTPNIKLGTLTKRSEFLHIRGGRYQAIGGIVIQMRPPKKPTNASDSDSPQEEQNQINVGFTATKKTGNAVVRNRCKRRMRALARELLPQYGKLGFDYVFIARAKTAQTPWVNLQKDVKKALLRLA